MIPIFRTRKDRLKPYFTNQLNSFIFSEVSPEFLASGGLSFMEGVPLPLHSQDLKSFIDKGLSTTKIADNIAIVIGSDTQFKYAEKYLQFLNHMFGDKLVEVFASKAQQAFKIGDCRRALAYLRAGMMFRQDSQTAMYSYAAGCRFWYLQLEGSDDKEEQELVKILKSEAHEYFQHLTNAYPEFAPGWYYLGYDYVNRGQYQRAQIAWKHYISAAEAAQGGQEEDPENIKEIQDRLEELADPVRIEQGAALLESGQAVEALRILEPYVQTGYNKWWPLHLCLAGAYRQLGYTNEAVEGYLNVLKLAPSNTDAMDALAEIYAQQGDAEKSEKYRNKAELVRKQAEKN